MRKILIVAGLLAASALISGSPAKAWVGCTCLKLGAPLTCTRGPIACTGQGGVCVLPCDYHAPKKVWHHYHHRHHHHKKKKM
jgi:hypothetical protein